MSRVCTELKTNKISLKKERHHKNSGNPFILGSLRLWCVPGETRVVVFVCSLLQYTEITVWKSKYGFSELSENVKASSWTFFLDTTPFGFSAIVWFVLPPKNSSFFPLILFIRDFTFSRDIQLVFLFKLCQVLILHGFNFYFFVCSVLWHFVKWVVDVTLKAVLHLIMFKKQTNKMNANVLRHVLCSHWVIILG